MNTTFSLARVVASIISVVWCYIEPSFNFIAVCFFALVLDCYTAWRCNRRIYSRFREQIKENPKCKMDGKLRSKKMAKMVQDFSVLIMAIFLATAIDDGLFGYMDKLHLANYLAAVYCAVQFVSILENESTCNGAAGRILVSSAQREGRRLICVTMNDPNDWQDHSALLEDGFSQYTIRKIVEEGEILGTVEVLGGSGSPVTVRSAEDFSYPMAEGERISVTLSGPGFVYAPVVADAQAGYAHICLDGSPVGKVKLVYEETEEQTQTEKPSFWKRLFGGDS